MGDSIVPDGTAKVKFRGAIFDRRMACALRVLEEKLGYELTVLQGCYSDDVTASAGTHSGGGAVDLTAYDWRRKVKLGREVGIALYRRPTIPGLWNEHVHGTLLGDPECSDAAKAQNQEYKAGGDGLVGDAPDPHPALRPDPIEVFDYRLYWRDKMLEQRIRGVKAQLKKYRDKLELLRHRRRKLHNH